MASGSGVPELIPDTHLALTGAGEVPFFSEFSAAPDVCYSENGAILLHPAQYRRAEERVNGDREAAVAYAYIG